METLQVLLAHVPHHLFSVHVCGDEVAAFANAMPHVEVFILRVIDSLRGRKCSHNHCAHD